MAAKPFYFGVQAWKSRYVARGMFLILVRFSSIESEKSIRLIQIITPGHAYPRGASPMWWIRPASNIPLQGQSCNHSCWVRLVMRMFVWNTESHDESLNPANTMTPIEIRDESLNQGQHINSISISQGAMMDIFLFSFISPSWVFFGSSSSRPKDFNRQDNTESLLFVNDLLHRSIKNLYLPCSKTSSSSTLTHHPSPIPIRKKWRLRSTARKSQPTTCE